MSHVRSVAPLRRFFESVRQSYDLAYRSLVVFSTAAVIAAGYLRAQHRAKKLSPEAASQLWEQQHRRSAPKLAQLAVRLRGLLVKSGQYLSARPDLLPVAYIEALAGLQDAVPSRPYRLIARRIERELGARPEELFAQFEQQPVASASLAQVHRARLRDGRTVAVKVLYPGIEGIVRSDIRNLGLIVNIVGRIWPRYDFRAVYREVARLVPYELDLKNEAANLQRIAADLAHRDDVVIPQYVPERSATGVLTMEFIEGMQIADVNAMRAAGINTRRTAERVVDLFGDQILAHGFFHGDPHPGNLLVLADGRIALLDFGQCLALSPEVRRGFALLSHSAATFNPAGMIEAVQMVGVHLPATDMAAYLRMARQTLGMGADPAEDAAVDSRTVNVRMARGFHGISLDGMSGEAMFVFRVQGLLRGLRARLGARGAVIAAWDDYAVPVLAEPEAEAAAS
ncbi:MAG TPA: AarF/ABC1/UbiB kinase family protein [Dehalococcoidia bacterium]|jgi:predicted unusual protein kinase regulating ubiquinone biosynthesis (AarF/ABC1/UbiB family)|nr:AarF/ABC1/UbiB kinase family protein [Dehalococcoidia bacterium]